MSKRKLELRILMEHEARMAQHPRDLFPDASARKGKEIICKGCKQTFLWDPKTKSRAFCTGDCKVEYYRRARSYMNKKAVGPSSL